MVHPTFSLNLIMEYIEGDRVYCDYCGYNVYVYRGTCPNCLTDKHLEDI